MKIKNILQSVLLWIVSFVATLHFQAAGIEEFNAIDAVGECKILEDALYEDIVIGAAYNFGKTVKTGRNSYLDLQLLKGNTFRLLARTTLVVTEDARNPKLKILKLDQGTVNLKLDNFPADHKLDVETPSAICGAVGTRFIVSFEDPTMVSAIAGSPGSRAHRFTCDEGELQIASRFTVDDEIVIGQSFTVDSVVAGSDMVAVIHEGQDNAYTDVTVNRGRLTFNYGGEDGMAFVIDAGEGGKTSRFTAAISKKEDGSEFVAFKIKKGFADFIFFGGETDAARITSADGAVFVPTIVAVKSIVKGSEANTQASQLLNAAFAEGQEFAKLTDMKNEPGVSDADIKNQEKRVRDAAARTNRFKNAISFSNQPSQFDPIKPPEDTVEIPDSPTSTDPETLDDVDPHESPPQ